MSDLLKHRIKTLMLNEEASFPSQARDAKDMIKEYQRGKRCRLVGVSGDGHDYRDHWLLDGDPDGETQR